MIGIIAAMDSEVEAIETLLEHKELKHISGIKMIQGTIKNKRVMVLKSGVGKGNAVMATTILLENFRIEKVINIGTAGGLKRNSLFQTPLLVHELFNMILILVPLMEKKVLVYILMRIKNYVNFVKRH